MSYCIPGDTCLSCESEMPLGRVNKLLEINLSDAEVLLFKPGPVRSGTRDWKWFKTDEIFSRVVERKCGGIASPAADPPMCRDRAPLKGSIQPRDGVWKLTPSPTVTENCEGLDDPTSREPSRELRRWENPFRLRLAEEESFADIDEAVLLDALHGSRDRLRRAVQPRNDVGGGELSRRASQ